MSLMSSHKTGLATGFFAFRLTFFAGKIDIQGRELVPGV